MAHPPGRYTVASLHLARIAPRKIIEERIVFIKCFEISNPYKFLVSIVRQSLCLFVSQPSIVKILHVLTVSFKFGHLLKTFFPFVKIVETIIGRLAFLEP